MRPQRPAVLGLFCAAAGAAAAADSTTQAHETVSVYLPEYGDSDWAALRGSVLSSDESVTAYTVFCADQAPNCQIAGELPFVFTEGAQTLVYTGSEKGITADLECDLDGKTAATCTGSTSYGSSYRGGSITGPTQTVWTSTFTATEVTWGVLTLSTPGPSQGTTDIEGTVVSPTSTPAPTSGASRVLGNRRVVMVSLGIVFLGFCFW